MKAAIPQGFRNYHYVLMGALVLALGGAALWPVEVVRVENSPKEEDRYIRRIHDEHTVGQSFDNHYYQIYALEVLARAEEPVAAVLVARDERGEELGRAAGTLTDKDQWFRIDFMPPLPRGRHTITLTIDAPLEREQALLIRFQPQSNRYSDGDMVVDGQASYGDIAFRAIERVPLWKAILIWGQVNGTSTRRGLLYAGYGAAVAAAVAAATRLTPKKWPAAAGWVPVALIFLVAVAVRVPYFEKIEGVFGGDAFNYLSKANALLQGYDPFAADPRKGPLYSFLLLPGLLMPDPFLWSRWVGSIAAAAAAALLPLVARRAGLPWALAVMSGLLLAVNQEFIWESPSGLAMTLFAALILLAAYAYLQIAQSKQWLWVLAVCAGLVMLTRFEGALVGAILLPAAWWRYRIPWKQMVPPLLLAGALMAIPFSSFLWSGTLGIRTPADIAGDDGLFLVRSIWDIQLWHNIERSYEFFTNVWAWRGHTIPVGAWLGAGLLVGAVVLLFKEKLPNPSRGLLTVAGAVLAAGLVLLFMMNNEINRDVLVIALWILTGIGLAGWLRRQPIDAAVIILSVLVQVGVIIWIVPKGRYFLPTVPFLSLALVYGLSVFMPAAGRRQHIIPLFLLGCASVFFYLDGRATLATRLEKYNAQAHDTAVMLNAVRQLRGERVRVGVHSTGDVPTLLYIPPARLVQVRSEDDVSNALAELRWMASHNVERLLERDREPRWASVEVYPQLFHTQTFDSRHGDAKVFVYTLDRAQLAEVLQ